MTRPTHAILVMIVVVLLAGIALIAIPRIVRSPQPVETATTTPAADSANWLTFEDAHVAFKYPESLPTKYLRATDWPPQATVSATSTCAGASDETGRTELRTIEGASYCVTEESEGAAGSTYTTYAYTTEREDGFVTLGFTLRYLQCANYNEPEQSACRAEREGFSVDALVALIAETLETK